MRASPGGAEALAALLDQHVSIVDAWGAGELYPGWDAVCIIAATADVTVDDLEALGDKSGTPASSGMLADAIALVMKAAYHHDIFKAAKAFRGNRLGVPATAQEA